MTTTDKARIRTQPSDSSRLPLDSSWIASIAYRRTPDKARYLAIFLKGKDGQEGETALLYGPTVKPWLPGLLSAGLGGRSIGRAYNKLMRGGKAREMGLTYQRIEGREKVQALRRMMDAA